MTDEQSPEASFLSTTHPIESIVIVKGAAIVGPGAPSPPEPLRPPCGHDPSTVAVVQIDGRWYTRFTTLSLPDPRFRGAAMLGVTYYMPHETGAKP